MGLKERIEKALETLYVISAHHCRVCGGEMQLGSSGCDYRGNSYSCVLASSKFIGAKIGDPDYIHYSESRTWSTDKARSTYANAIRIIEAAIKDEPTKVKDNA